MHGFRLFNLGNRCARLRLFLVLMSAAPILAGPLGAQPQFANPVYEVGFSPFGLVKADFDGDGIADLVSANTGSGSDPAFPEAAGSLSLLRGMGDGTFQEAVHIPALSHPGEVFAADVNGDDRPDLLIYSSSGFDGIISLRLNLGGGAFGPEQILVSATNISLGTGDFNGDGRVDILLASRDDQFYVAVLFGNGNGTFVQAPRFPIGFVRNFTVADLNGDGRDDVVAVSDQAPDDPVQSRNDIRTFLSRGDGAFDSGPTVPLPEFGWLLLPVDLDGDGFVDLAVNTLHHEGDVESPGPLLTFFGHGDGTFEPGPVNITSLAYKVEAVEVNRDGITDLLVLDDGSFRVLLGNGDRTWSLAMVRAGAYSAMVVGDWEGDGLPDVALPNNLASAVFTFSGNGDGTFGPRPIASLSGLVAMATGDFNGDGRLDLAAGRPSFDDVAIVLGNGDGTFGAEAVYPAGTAPRAVAVADFNRDGRPDLAVLDANWYIFPPSPIIEGSLSILFGNGDGTFGAPVQYPSGGGFGAPVPSPTGHRALLAIGDVNGDGAPDAVVVNDHGDGSEASDLAVFLNDGTGSLGVPTRLALDVAEHPPYGWTRPDALAVGDVTGDGHADIAVAILGLLWREPTPIPGKLMLIPGNGDGTFQPGITVVEGENPGGVAMGDLNRDGRSDLVLADSGAFFMVERPGHVQVILAGPGGSFQPLAPVAAGTGPSGLGIADLNGDLIPDLVVSNSLGYLAVMPGLGDGALGTRTNYGLFTRTLVPAIHIQGDFTSDGLNDLVVATDVGAFLLPNRTTQHLEVTATVSFNAPQGKGSGLISWTTDSERDVRGFNVVVNDSRGRRQINSALIPCEQCTTGLGASYATLVPKHKGGHNLYIEVVHRNGRVDAFGPAQRE